MSNPVNVMLVVSVRKWCRAGAIYIIKGYQRLVSPLLGSRCRFTPTCSQYAIDAIERFGVIKGGVYSFLRILRCSPLCKGGYDPIPEIGESLRQRRRINRELSSEFEKKNSEVDVNMEN